MAIRTVTYAFGASVQDANACLVLNSKNTLEAVKFIKALLSRSHDAGSIYLGPILEQLSHARRHDLTGA